VTPVQKQTLSVAEVVMARLAMNYVLNQLPAKFPEKDQKQLRDSLVDAVNNTVAGNPVAEPTKEVAKK
jgi:hypothetical protein